MSFRVSTNIAAMAAQRNLSIAQRQTEKSLMALASGSRITRPADDAAGFAIAERLRSQEHGLKQAQNNAEAAQAMLQTAEGSLNEQNNILIRLRELAVYSASDTVGDEERGYLNGEYQQLTAEFDRIAQSSRFGNKHLLTGSGEEFDFHVGADSGEENRIHFTLDADSSANAVGIDGLSIADKDDALDVLQNLDEAINKIAGNRATFGASQSRLSHAVDNLAVQRESISGARSVIADADIAEEASKLAQSQIIQDAGVMVLAQANMNTGRIAKLLS